MARVGFAPAAAEDLEGLIRTHSLPADTRVRVRRSLTPLQRFLLLGRELAGGWDGYRFVLGPWRWLLLVYEYIAEADLVLVVTVQDGRASRSPAAEKR